MPATTLLPGINDTIKIPGKNIDEFRQKGHILIKGLLNKEEVTAYHEVIKNAAEKYNTEKRKMQDRDTYGKAFLQIMNLWRNDENVKRYVLSKRFAKVAADLLGVNNVRIYHDQALYKEPGGGPTPWHQDQYYWPIDTHNTITMWMPLVDITIDMGIITFASDSHKNGSIFSFEISDESDQQFDKYVKDKNFEISSATAMNAGDATWHYGYTIHNAPGNQSGTMREVMTIIYLAGDAKIKAPDNKWQQNDLEKWLMNQPVGSIASSELNPLVL